jgi:hypothetical protein
MGVLGGLLILAGYSFVYTGIGHFVHPGNPANSLVANFGLARVLAVPKPKQNPRPPGKTLAREQATAAAQKKKPLKITVKTK